MQLPGNFRVEYEKEIQKRKAKNAEELKKVTRAIKEHESMKRSPPSPAKGSPPTAHASCESIKAPRHELPSPLLMLSQPKFQTGQLIYAIYGSSKRRGFQKFKGTIVASHAHGGLYTYDVKYADGDFEDNVPERSIRTTR